MEKKYLSLLFYFAVLVLFVPMLFLAGCTEDHLTIDASVADPHGTVTGKVIAGTTRVGIPKATVTLIVNGTLRRTVTKTDPFPTDTIDDAGFFEFGGVPSGQHQLRVEASGFATIQTLVTVPFSNEANQPVTVNQGNIVMAEVFELIVNTINGKTGAPVTGITVFAEPTNQIASECEKLGGFDIFDLTSDDSFEITDVSATENDSAKAHLVGLNKCEVYIIVAPAQSGFITSSSTFLGGTNQANEMTLVLIAEVDNTSGFGIISSNFGSGAAFSAANLGVVDEGNTGVGSLAKLGFTLSLAPHATTRSTGSTGNIVLVFSHPIALNGGFEITHVNDLIDPDTADAASTVDFPDAGFPKVVTTAVTTTLSANETVLTINPNTNLPPNESIILHGRVSAAASKSTLDLETLGSTDAAGIYVSDDTASSLTALSQVTADNYNGSTGDSDLNDDGTVDKTTVFLEFPEAVTGSFRIVCVADTSPTCSDTGSSPVTIGPTNSTVVFTDGRQDAGNAFSCPGGLLDCTGSGAGVIFRVNTGVALADDNLESNNEISVFLDVTTADGTRLQGVVILPVQ